MIIERIKNNIKTLRTLGLGGWVYYAWHGRKTSEIPHFLAKLVRGKDPDGYVRLNSYDGSGQCVHPDVIRYKDHLYLAFTPYPYAVDNYENPQLAIWDNGLRLWNTIISEPFAKPQNAERYHYSDPFLFIYDNKLLYFYRLSDKYNDSKSVIFYTELDGDIVNCRAGGMDEKRFTEFYDYEYTSPFLIYE